MHLLSLSDAILRPNASRESRQFELKKPDEVIEDKVCDEDEFRFKMARKFRDYYQRTK